MDHPMVINKPLIKAVHSAISDKIVILLRSQGAKTAAELGLKAPQPVKVDFIDTAFGDLSIILIGLFYNYAMGTWTSAFNVVVLLLLVGKWSSLLSIDLHLDSIPWYIEYADLVLAVPFYRIVDGAWMNWDVPVLSALVFWRWFNKTEHPSQAFDFLYMRKAAQRPRAPLRAPAVTSAPVSEKETWSVRLLGDLISISIGSALLWWFEEGIIARAARSTMVSLVVRMVARVVIPWVSRNSESEEAILDVVDQVAMVVWGIGFRYT